MMMVEEGRLEDLSPYLEEDLSWKTNIEPFVLQGSTYADGEVYLGPISTSAFTCAGIFWNEDLFAQAGIERFPGNLGGILGMLRYLKGAWNYAACPAYGGNRMGTDADCHGSPCGK